jgi:U3 small nucleolar RNA-associated protein 5
LLSRDGEGKTTPPRADSMLQLLLQGLNNRDLKILDSVLYRADDDLIEKTVRRLPVEAVLPLITELQRYIKARI